MSKTTTVKLDDKMKAQEEACWKQHQKDIARAEKSAMKQADKMLEEYNAGIRAEELAAEIPVMQAEGSTIEDRKQQGRKRRETKAAKKQATAQKAAKAKAEYNTQLQKARNAGKKVPRSAGKGIKSLEKRGAKFTKA